MLRPFTLLFGFGFGLLLSVSACDKGGSDAEEQGEEETGPDVNECGTEWAEKDGATQSIMEAWGAACTVDDDCLPLLGEGAKCIHNILGVYDLPGGYCTRECHLADTSVSFELDSADCDPNGGVACVGVEGAFTACALPCESHDQCGREGFGCRLMPNIAAEGDPTFCLMNATDCCTTDSGECGA
jgi:hypothetical protein